MATKWVYLFSEGNANMRNLLGGKGANLAEMTNLGLPVPQGFTITTEACTQYYEDGRKINDEIMGQIMEYIGKMEEITGKKFGDKENPLLVSVRSGARASMPGMMDTILNLGLNEEVVEVLAKKSGNPRWAWDCYRRFIQMFSDVVMEVGKKYFEELIDKMKAEKGVKQDVELTAEDLHDLAEQFRGVAAIEKMHEERYRKLGSIRIATKYPSITRAHFARTGTQVEIVYLHGNIELAPITGMAERIVDITATGTTLRENNLEIVEEVLASTARFFANGCALRTDERIVALARVLAENAPKHTYAPIAGASNPVQPTLS